MSVFKPKTELCPVCSKDRVLDRMPFPLEPDIPVCADCIDAIWNKGGCAHWEEGCCDCPLWRDGYGDYSCNRMPFPLSLIGYDPAVTYKKPEQLTLL